MCHTPTSLYNESASVCPAPFRCKHRERVCLPMYAVNTDRHHYLSLLAPFLPSEGVVKFLLPDIAQGDWAEIIKPIGHRIILREAASNVWHKAEMKNLESAIERMKCKLQERFFFLLIYLCLPLHISRTIPALPWCCVQDGSSVELMKRPI